MVLGVVIMSKLGAYGHALYFIVLVKHKFISQVSSFTFVEKICNQNVYKRAIIV